MSDVVVAESSRTLATLIRLTLSGPGYRLRFVNRGREVLDAVRRGPTHLVVLDAGLSDLSGYDVAEALRGDPATRAVPIILTHHDYDPPDRARIQRLDIADVVPKPFERQSLLERVRAIVPPRPIETEPKATAGDPARVAPGAIAALTDEALNKAVDAAVLRAVAGLGPRLEALLDARLEQALDTEVRQLVKSKAESIVWKAVGELAEGLIRDEITRLTTNDPE